MRDVRRVRLRGGAQNLERFGQVAEADEQSAEVGGLVGGALVAEFLEALRLAFVLLAKEASGHGGGRGDADLA